MAFTHSFHIPVMGIGYTIDTPLKVSPFGIDSVISLVDDILIEKLRKMYCRDFKLPYEEISSSMDDFRAKRITAYLNMIHQLVEEKFEKLKKSSLEPGSGLWTYLNLLPEDSVVKQEYRRLSSRSYSLKDLENWLRDHLTPGSIDVNIMTKVDKDNYVKKEKLPVEYNDAHAALRGYAQSNLSSSLVLSAGMNPRLYSYLEGFADFYPDKNGQIKKKIILKVSDYRSALVQGKMLAKRGIWVSEYRIESGLNCGGHAFATEGYLLGPILAEFKEKRKELKSEIGDVLVRALLDKKLEIPAQELSLKISAQGGVGTAEEHHFLLNHYEVDSVGWGSPFLLVPEVTNVDSTTLKQLKRAKEEDLYLSHISPLGVPFNNLRGNTKDLEKKKRILKHKPGSSCPKRYVALNQEFTEQGLCTASRQYQYLKLKELDQLELSDEERYKREEKIMEKSCICVGLGTSALLVNNLETKTEGDGVSICPGPNLAYFSKTLGMKEMVDHICGRANIMERKDRPNMMIKELSMYIEYLKDKIEETLPSSSRKQQNYLVKFAGNLLGGVDYYIDLFKGCLDHFEEAKVKVLSQLEEQRERVVYLSQNINQLTDSEKPVAKG
ncbi:hypothetical protein KFE98_17085 [bacterium SCSIO 12741]|nr:hypothetical protein KFE98_17085 [bacterium SCSIO 12741]